MQYNTINNSNREPWDCVLNVIIVPAKYRYLLHNLWILNAAMVNLESFTQY